MNNIHSEYLRDIIRLKNKKANKMYVVWLNDIRKLIGSNWLCAEHTSNKEPKILQIYLDTLSRLTNKLDRDAKQDNIYKGIYLGYFIYRLKTVWGYNNIKERYSDRLKLSNEFNGAYFEMQLATQLTNINYNIEPISECNKTKTPDFILNKSRNNPIYIECKRTDNGNKSEQTIRNRIEQATKQLDKDNINIIAIHCSYFNDLDINELKNKIYGSLSQNTRISGLILIATGVKNRYLRLPTLYVENNKSYLDMPEWFDSSEYLQEFNKFYKEI